MTAQTEQRAKLTVLESAEAFVQALEAESSSLQLYIETTMQDPKRDPKWDSAASGSEAAERFRRALEQDHHHLSLRAFSPQVEYGWFGTTGVQVELSPSGDLEAKLTKCYSEQKPDNDDPVQTNVCVRQLRQNGRVIYEKLERYEPRATDRKGGER